MTNQPQSAAVASFELRRRIDGLVYHFDKRTDAAGREAYLRRDAPLWIIRHPSLGWIAGEHDSEVVYGRPWDIPPSAQGNAPPEGTWVSRKGNKSYVYDLVHISETHSVSR